MPDISTLTQKIITFCQERDWIKHHNAKDLAISLSLESSELLEHFQWKDNVQTNTHIQNNKEEIEDEMADVAIYLLQLAHFLNVDLSAAIDNKMKKNAVKYPID